MKVIPNPIFMGGGVLFAMLHKNSGKLMCSGRNDPDQNKENAHQTATERLNDNETNKQADTQAETHRLNRKITIQTKRHTGV